MPERAASEVTIVCGSLRDHQVAVLAAWVNAIGEHRDAEREGAGITDVASILGVTPPLGPRRALRVSAGAGDAGRWLVMGERVSVRTLPADAFGAFPEWLKGIGASLPFAGLVALDGAFAIELDLVRLISEGT